MGRLFGPTGPPKGFPGSARRISRSVSRYIAFSIEARWRATSLAVKTEADMPTAATRRSTGSGERWEHSADHEQVRI